LVHHVPSAQVGEGPERVRVILTGAFVSMAISAGAAWAGYLAGRRWVRSRARME